MQQQPHSTKGICFNFTFRSPTPIYKALKQLQGCRPQYLSLILPPLFPGDSGLKNLPTKQEVQVPFLSWEDPLEEAMIILPSIFAWEIPWTEEPGGLQSMGSQKSWTQLRD